LSGLKHKSSLFNTLAGLIINAVGSASKDSKKKISGFSAISAFPSALYLAPLVSYIGICKVVPSK
jgi:hypothetical protein